jgi:tetratricopeptide (TPR) repeat protein
MFMKGSSRLQDVTALLDAAAAHYAAGRLDEAARLYRQVEAADPADVRAPYSLAVIDIRRGRAEPARRRLRAVVAREPGLFAAQQNLGAVCQSLGLWPEAAEAYARALAMRPEAAETHFSLTRALTVLGRIGEAVCGYRALAGVPAHRLRALTRLAMLDPAAIDPADLADLRRGAAAADTDPQTRIGVWFALGEALDRAGADDEAFAAFAAGNRLKHQALAASADASMRPDAVARAHDATLRLVTDLFTADALAGAGTGSRSAAPIFIIGMPRSGSSLIEQILASHAKVQGLGESAALSDAVDRGFTGAAMKSADWRRLAEAYLDSARRLGWTGTPRLVDKTLENHLRVGLIHKMFPRAVILHSLRDPVDTCLACYRQLFVSGNETLYDLGQIGEAYVRYREAMAHWARVLPGRVIDVEHEVLVADPEARIRWLVSEACGLDWDPACLSFHEASGAVRTASAAQVRRPIFSTSVRRWRRYERHLGPLFAALGPYAPGQGASAQGRP